MARIFLSYAREDRPSAERLARLIEGDGHDVWWDRHIEGGSQFSDRIEEELAKADVVVVAWSQASVKSRWVRDEASVAGDDGRLLPLSIDGVRPPMGFRQFHTVDVSDWVQKGHAASSEIVRNAVRSRLGGETSRGVAPVLASARPKRWTGRTLMVAAIALTLLIAGIGGYRWWRGHSQKTSTAPLSIQLLPFVASGGDEALQSLANDARDGLAEALSLSSISLVESDKSANGAKADLAISGRFTAVADGVHAVVKVTDLSNNLIVFNRQIDGTKTEGRAFSERVSAQLAGTLGWAAALIALEKHHPSNPPVMADLMRQLDFTSDGLANLQTATRAARRSPNSAFARLSHAFGVANFLEEIPLSERAHAIDEAKVSAKRALELAPEFGDSYAVQCFLRSETFRADCERQLLKGYRIDPDAPFATAFLSQLYEDVGRTDEAREFASLSYSRDPYVPTKIGWMLRALEMNGQDAEAERLFGQGLRWWPEFHQNFLYNRMTGLALRGDFAGLARLANANRGVELRGSFGQAGIIADAVQSRSVERLKQTCGQVAAGSSGLLCILAFSTVGELDIAFALADKQFGQRVGRSEAETDRIWRNDPSGASGVTLLSAPAAENVRRDPRFLDIARRTGLLDYWRTTHLPDFCTKGREPVCAQFRKG